jgi:PKD repeat protein
VDVTHTYADNGTFTVKVPVTGAGRPEALPHGARCIVT